MNKLKIIIYFFISLQAANSQYLGVEYLGTTSTTHSNKACLPWNLTVYNNPALFPEANASSPLNYCRNPDPSIFVGGVWCFTKLNDITPNWELCDVPMCKGNPIKLIRESRDQICLRPFQELNPTFALSEWFLHNSKFQFTPSSPLTAIHVPHDDVSKSGTVVAPGYGFIIIIIFIYF